MSWNYKETACISVCIAIYVYTSLHLFSGLNPEFNFSDLEMMNKPQRIVAARTNKENPEKQKAKQYVELLWAGKWNCLAFFF